MLSILYDEIFADSMKKILQALNQLDSSQITTTTAVNSCNNHNCATVTASPPFCTNVTVHVGRSNSVCPTHRINNALIPGIPVRGSQAANITVTNNEAVVNDMILEKTYNSVIPIADEIQGRFCTCVTNTCRARANTYCRCQQVCSCNQVCSPCSPCSCNIN